MLFRKNSPKNIFLITLITILQVIFTPQNTILLIKGDSKLIELKAVAQNNQPNINTQEIYYQISGTTAQQLRQQMNKLGPRGYDAYTEWNIKWNYRYQQRNNQCRIASVVVNTTIKITLPAWRIPANASQKLKQQWNNYLNKLRLHEQGHQQHGINASNDVFKSLNNTPAYATCSQLERAANQAGYAIIKGYNQRDLVYDQETEHGATQGAVFP
jgi:predicted secreted Zn-dependent protease